MKRKIFAVLAALTLLASVGFAETIELSAGSYIVGEGDVAPGVYVVTVGGSSLKAYLPAGEEIIVEDALSLEAVEVSGFSAEIGEYIVGSDLPAGKYKVQNVDGGDFSEFSVWNADGRLKLSEYIRDDGFIGQAVLEDGDKVSVKKGALHFGPASGITFD